MKEFEFSPTSNMVFLTAQEAMTDMVRRKKKAEDAMFPALWAASHWRDLICAAMVGSREFTYKDFDSLSVEEVADYKKKLLTLLMSSDVQKKLLSLFEGSEKDS